MDEEGLVFGDGPDGELAHETETTVVLEDVKDSGDALGLFFMAFCPAVEHHSV